MGIGHFQSRYDRSLLPLRLGWCALWFAARRFINVRFSVRTLIIELEFELPASWIWHQAWPSAIAKSIETPHLSVHFPEQLSHLGVTTAKVRKTRHHLTIRRGKRSDVSFAL